MSATSTQIELQLVALGDGIAAEAAELERVWCLAEGQPELQRQVAALAMSHLLVEGNRWLQLIAAVTD